MNLEQFDLVAKHLLTQGSQSLAADGRSCMYRGENGTKCAIGVVIADEFYDPSFEGASVCILYASPGVPIHIKQALAPYMAVAPFEAKRLIRDLSGGSTYPETWAHVLQLVHDAVPVKNWAKTLTQLREIILKRQQNG